MSSLPYPGCAVCPHYLCNAVPASRLAITEGLRALWNGRDVGLTHGEFQIVRRLIAANGDYVCLRALYEVVKPPGFCAGYGDDGWKNNVRSVVKRIRGKFRRVDPGFTVIRTYNGGGYAWKEVP